MGETALHAASTLCVPGLLDLLLEDPRIDVNARDGVRAMCIFLCMALSLQHCIACFAVSQRGRTALHCAALAGTEASEHCVRLLLADPRVSASDPLYVSNRRVRLGMWNASPLCNFLSSPTRMAATTLACRVLGIGLRRYQYYPWHVGGSSNL